MNQEWKFDGLQDHTLPLQMLHSQAKSVFDVELLKCRGNVGKWKGDSFH